MFMGFAVAIITDAKVLLFLHFYFFALMYITNIRNSMKIPPVRTWKLYALYFIYLYVDFMSNASWSTTKLNNKFDYK